MTLAPDTYVCNCDCHRAPEYLPHRKPCCLEYADKLLSEGLAHLLDREISDPDEQSSKSVAVTERMLALEEVREWSAAAREAREMYVKAVMKAHVKGIPSADIARAGKVTSAAVRMLIKRKFG